MDEYTLIQALSPGELDVQVNTMLLRYWRLHGTLVVTPRDNHLLFLQAMTKHKSGGPL